MNSIVEAEIQSYLRNVLYYDPYEAATIVHCMRDLARTAGHELDERFRHANMGAGPEGRVASSITDRALGGAGTETSMYAIRQQIGQWLRTNARRPAFAG